MTGSPHSMSLCKLPCNPEGRPVFLRCIFAVVQSFSNECGANASLMPGLVSSQSEPTACAPRSIVGRPVDFVSSDVRLLIHIFVATEREEQKC